MRCWRRRRAGGSHHAAAAEAVVCIAAIAEAMHVLRLHWAAALLRRPQLPRRRRAAAAVLLLLLRRYLAAVAAHWGRIRWRKVAERRRLRRRPHLVVRQRWLRVAPSATRVLLHLHLLLLHHRFDAAVVGAPLLVEVAAVGVLCVPRVLCSPAALLLLLLLPSCWAATAAAAAARPLLLLLLLPPLVAARWAVGYCQHAQRRCLDAAPLHAPPIHDRWAAMAAVGVRDACVAAPAGCAVAAKSSAGRQRPAAAILVRIGRPAGLLPRLHLQSPVRPAEECCN